jgi:hypothetical protein
MPKREWDETDAYALNYYHWEQYARRHNITKRHGKHYLPKCNKCNGVGQDFDPITYQSLGNCVACNGRGFKAPHTKFSDEEIKDIVNGLGEQRIGELVNKYGKQRKQR